MARRINAALAVWVLVGGLACSSRQLQGNPTRGTDGRAVTDGGTIVDGEAATDGPTVADAGGVADGGSVADAATVPGHGDGVPRTDAVTLGGACAVDLVIGGALSQTGGTLPAPAPYRPCRRLGGHYYVKVRLSGDGRRMGP